MNPLRPLWEPLQGAETSGASCGPSALVQAVYGLRTRPCILVDRDGTLTKYTPGHITRPQDLEPIPGAQEAVRELVVRYGSVILVVTNQSAIGRGWMSTHDYARINVRFRELFPEVVGVYTCPHDPTDGCGCRKPKGTMLREAERQARSRYNAHMTCFVGDAKSDMEAAESADIPGARVLSGSQLGLVNWRGDTFRDFVDFTEHFEERYLCRSVQM